MSHQTILIGFLSDDSLRNHVIIVLFGSSSVILVNYFQGQGLLQNPEFMTQMMQVCVCISLFCGFMSVCLCVCLCPNSLVSHVPANDGADDE